MVKTSSTSTRFYLFVFTGFVTGVTSLSFPHTVLAQDVPPPTSRPVLSEGEAKVRFDSLERSVKGHDSLDRIITRYEQFVVQVEGTQVHQLATERLEIWKLRQARNMVLLNGEWVEPADLIENEKQATLKALRARELMLADEPALAKELIDQALTQHPDNLSATYLLGVATLSTDPKLAIASFEKIRDALPTHVPTLNNLAKLYIENGKPQLAVLAMKQAMERAMYQTLVDNARELTRLVPGNVADSPAAQEMNAILAEQEARLIVRNQAAGLTRLGATWVDAQSRAAMLDLSLSQEQRTQPMRDQREILAGDFSVLKREMIENIDLIRQIERDQNQAGRSSYPDTYYRLRARVTELRSGMEQIQARITRLDRQIAVVFAGQSADGFTGRLRPILEDGVPVKSSILAELDMPTTIPTTLPTTLPATSPTSQPVN